MAKPKAEKKSDIIKEGIKFEGSKDHALKTLFDGDPDDIPFITSIGYMGIPETNKYISYVIISKGREILSIEVSEPDFKAIAEDEAKINFVNCFMPGVSNEIN